MHRRSRFAPSAGRAAAHGLHTSRGTGSSLRLMEIDMTDKKKPAAYIFGARPETLSAPVQFKSVTGVDVDIVCQFKYRDRVEFAAFWDEISDAKAPELKEGEKFTFERIAGQGLSISAERTLKFLHAWPLELDVNKANLMRMFREEPAAAGAFWDAYRGACAEGRLGN